MRYLDGNGALTDAERNPSLSEKTRRNYSGFRRNQTSGEAYYEMIRGYPIDENEVKEFGRAYAKQRRDARARRDAAKKQYGNLAKETSLTWAVIQLHTRQGFSLSDCAYILGVCEDDIRWAWDIAQQNAE